MRSIWNRFDYFHSTLTKKQNFVPQSDSSAKITYLLEPIPDRIKRIKENEFDKYLNIDFLKKESKKHLINRYINKLFK